MNLPLYQIDAFAEQVFQGNPAAVCPLEEWLPDNTLKAIAGENNLSETAFFVGSDGQYDLRWFTPTKEVDLCGHATLAAAHVLFGTSCQTLSQINFDSRSGPLQVQRENDLLTLDFPNQAGELCQTPEALLEALGSTPKECLRSTNYMAVFDSEETVAKITPDFQRLCDLDLQGVIITAPGKEVDFVSRFFVPKFGIKEDPVTGSTHCTLTPYWAKKLGKTTLSARQTSARGGNLQCRLVGNRVYISGKAVTYLEGTIQLGHL